MKKWHIEDSADLYNINGWGVSYFGINEKGHIMVTPKKNGIEIDLREVMDEFSSRANVHFIPGESLMDDPCGIYCDGLHLSTYAQVLLGIRLAERMRPFLPK